MPQFAHFGIVSSDFPTCDIQRRFEGESMGVSIPEVRKIMNYFKEFPRLIRDNIETSSKLAKLDIPELRRLKVKNVTKLGCIVNTDGCYGPGMHWVSLYIDID
jgi:hypothetical protein